MRGESSALEGIADLVPSEHVSDELRSSIDKLSEHLDGLLFLDHTAELAVDRSAFLALCRDEQLLPAEIRDIFILETAKYCGRRLKEFETKGRRLRWREAEKYGLVGHAGVDELAERGYKPTMSQEDIEAAIGDWYPDMVPGKAIEHLNDRKGRQWLIKRLQRNRTYWDCIVANLGWFAAINIIGTSILLLVLLASGLPGYVIMILLIAFSGALTAFVLLSCAFNQEFHF